MEKKTIIVIALIIATLSLTSCQTEEEKAREAAFKYSYAMGNYDIDGAERYATEETIETTLAMARTFLSILDSAYIDSDTPAKLEVTNMEMTSDTSAVVSFVKNTPIKQDLRFSVEVRKRNGKWLAHSPQNGAESQQR